QVEHTVTEQVMGIDLVCAQFRLAAGATLAELGLPDQAAVGSPRGYAVQARVVTQGPGRLTAYKEPAGPGIRVDGSAYLGWAPPPQFDPLLAKVIATTGQGSTIDAAVERAARALSEFHVAGLPTNIASLQAVLAQPAVRAGDARTTLFAEVPELLQPAGDLHCRELRLGNQDGWRLPSKDEVPRFAGVEGLEATEGYHWTRTPFDDDLKQVWIVDFADPAAAPATTIPRDRKPFRIRCVKEP
ncbi:MAG: hypothetical protein KC431_04195, partial [Myxococcales bacterium]|nr:hypothetical protein [Myxococcales bacterium]